MTYLVFILITAAALAYLFFADHGRRPVVAEAADQGRNRLEERLESLRLSIKDLEYEKSVGKLDQQDYSRLENTLLIEWDEVEKQIAALPVLEKKTNESAGATCASCGASVLAEAAKFCHACGARLSQILVTVIFFMALVQSAPLSAFDIKVTLKNGTSGAVESAPLAVQLLKLEQGMQPVTKKQSAGGHVEFLNLPEMTAGPYMVQAEYRGVTYSRAIPPNMPSPADITLEIFENTASADKLRVRTLLELRRTDKNVLTGLMILFFVNRDKRTFTGGKNGLEFKLPAEAEVGEASISVGSGTSNIKWLKISPQKTERAQIYAVGHNVKPGERILQVMFRMPYDERSTAIDVQQLYPQDTGIQLLVEPEDIIVKQGEKTLTRVLDENLGRGLIGFMPRESEIKLILLGGGIAEGKKNEEAEVEIKSPLSLWQKFVFPLIAVAAFALVGWFKSRRAII